VAARIGTFHDAGIELFMLQFQPFEAEMRRSRKRSSRDQAGGPEQRADRAEAWPRMIPGYVAGPLTVRGDPSVERVVADFVFLVGDRIVQALRAVVVPEVVEAVAC
jgi:hypothetical protein